MSSPPPGNEEPLIRALAAAELRDTAGALRALTTADLPLEQERAWRTTLLAIANHGQLQDAEETAQQVKTWPSRECAPIARLALGWLARYAAYTFNRPLAQCCAEHFKQLQPPQNSSNLGDYEALIWSALWSRDLPDDLNRLAAIASDARAPLSAAHHTLAGLICWANGKRKTGLGHWRLASELARKSRSPNQQFFANILLARARRHFGQPHLASRILTSMSRSAETEPTWSAWLSWEQAMAGEPLDAATPPPTRSLREALAACDQAKREAMPQCLQEAYSCARQWPLVGEDVAIIAETFGLDDSALPSAGLKEWKTGEIATLPGAVKGLVTAIAAPRQERRGELDLSTSHFVWLRPQVPARRIHARAAPLFSDLQRLDATELRDTKTLTLLAELGLRSGPQPLEDVFEAVYGFAYQSARHQAIMDTLVYRGRKRLEGLAILNREEASLELVPVQPFLLADPRDEAGLVDRVLSLIGSGTHTSVGELSLALGVSARTIQRTLKPLVEEGACVPKKQGKAVHYEVEDTTFHEPTEIIG